MGRIAGVTAEETRTRLVAAAARVFNERGYERSTIADITRAAGLSSGAVYGHFRSKGALLAEAIRSRSTDAVAQLLSANPAISVPDALFTLGSALPRNGHPQTSLLVEAVVAARRDPELAAALADDFTDEEQRFVDAIAAAKAHGELNPSVSPAVIARFSLMLGLGSAMVRLLGLPPIDDAEWERFMQGLIRGLRAKQPQT